MRISQLKVTDSVFFGESLQLAFSEKLNCVMGGRGSGKTTILALIQWAINDDAILSRELLGLVKANLGSGTIEIIFSDEQGAVYKVVKSFGSNPIIRLGNGSPISIEEFNKKVAVKFFPTGSIEKIGIDAGERLKIFDGYIGNEIEKIKGEIGIIVSQLKQNEIELRSAKRESFKLNEDQGNFGSVAEEIKATQAELAKTEVDAKVKENFDIETKKQNSRTIEQNFIDRLKEAISKSNEEIRRLASTLVQAQALLTQADKFETTAVEELREHSKKVIGTILDSAKAMDDSIKTLAVEVVGASKNVRGEHLLAESKFSELKQTIAKHRDIFQKLNILSQRETAQKVAQEQLKKINEQVKELNAHREVLLQNLQRTMSVRSETRRSKAAEINQRLGDKVKILVKESALNVPFQELLRTIVTKSQMRTTAVELTIVEKSTPAELVKYIKSEKSAEYATKLAVDRGRMSELFKAVMEQDAIYDLESCVCEDAPNFFLAVEDAGNVEAFKPTEELSTGQRCTAVLPVIFAVTSDPLLIDQPEDNLDNRYIAKSIHQIIRAVKETRQLVFITHNPNIPVISDSEFNAFLTYQNQESTVSVAGNISAVKSQIVELLEGGQDAFKKRQEIYGY
jgi:energy-coupling factor transporter ATP-binding protein EcfA2